MRNPGYRGERHRWGRGFAGRNAAMAVPDNAEAVARVKAANPLPALVAQHVRLQRSGRDWIALCPFHGERTPSFVVYPEHFHCYGCGAHGDAIGWVMRVQRMTFADALRHLGEHDRKLNRSALAPAAPAAPDVNRARNIEAARRIWTEATDPTGTAAEAYLNHRRVALPDTPVIRFHPRCPRSGGALPAMVALMVDPANGTPCGVHRTFLRPDGLGKASVDRPKMMLGTAGVVRLAEPISEGLGLAEGIETALSVLQAIRWGPVWAAGSSSGIERFPVLPGHSLTIFADSDPVGRAAARACAARWTDVGREALIWTPPTGQDWNDAARRLAE
jgi:CHC2 zinc finger/Toprim domain